MPAQIDFSKPIDISKLKTAEDIKKVQQFLLDQSDESVKYNLGPSGVDGKLGKKDSYTRKAIAQYNDWLAQQNAQSQAQAEQERLAREAEQKKVAEQKAQENVAQVVSSTTPPAKQLTTPVQTSTPTTTVPAPKTTVVLPSSIDTKQVVEDLYPKKDKATTPAEKPAYDVTGPEIEAAGVTATQNKTLKPIDMLNLGQMEMHKDRVNAIKGIGKTGEEDTTETTTATENPTATQTFDQAMADRSYIQSLFDERRKAAEKERTNQLALASYNSLGNALRSLAQPLGWWAGGSTVGVQPYDRRAYLDAFNRAVAAGSDLRNIDNQETQFLINRAEYDRRQVEELEQYKARRKEDLEYQKQLYGVRGEYLDKQIAGRIQVAEASAKAKYKFKIGNTKATDSFRDSIIKRAGMAYAAIIKDYEISRQNGAEGLKEPISFDEFLKKFASENGYTLEGTESAVSSANPTSTSSKATSSSAGSANPTGKTPPSRQKTTTGADNSKVPPSKRK